MTIGEKFLFLLSIFSIPIQLGKHFWPDFSIVSGIRVDYLSPTLHLTDILLILLFLSSFKRLYESYLNLARKSLFIYTFSVLLLGIVMSESPFAGLFKVLKLLEFIFLAFYISNSFRLDFKNKLIYLLTLGGLTQFIILLLQFLSQGSLNGPFYFLGERSMNPSTIGAAVFSFNNEIVLRPYGTFPHPNVLSYYLLFPFTFLLFSFQKKEYLVLKVTSLTILFTGIILTFSRISILISIGILFFYFSKDAIKNKKTIYAFFIPLLFFLSLLLFSRFISSFVRDASLRLDLLKISFSEFLKFPLLGIGLNNFFYHEISYQKTISPVLLQPVHNIYALWVVETGVLGGVALFIFLKNAFKKARDAMESKDSFYNSVGILFFTSLIIGFFDHYLLTLQQGQILLAVLIGLLWIKVKD